MVYDCFSFFNELDLLEIRLNVLKDVVDKFVLVEAAQTHTGQPKPLYFSENSSRFAAFRDKVIHIVVDDFSDAEKFATERERAWARENIQRNAIVKGLVEAKPDDVVVISDLDEIPNPESIITASRYAGITRIGMRLYYYFLNYRNYSIPEWRLGTQVLHFSDFVDSKNYANFEFGQFVLKEVNQIPSASMIRFTSSGRIIRDGGWHFSYLGGIESIKTKLASFAHTEFDAKAKSDEWIRDRINKGEDIFLRGDRLFAEQIDEMYPRYIVANRDKLEHLIYSVDDEYLKRTRFSRAYCRIVGFIKALIAFFVPKSLVPFVMRVRDSVHGVRASKEHV